jgi:hypothetical protein
VAKTVNMEKSRAEVKMIQGENTKAAIDHLVETMRGAQ